MPVVVLCETADVAQLMLAEDVDELPVVEGEVVVGVVPDCDLVSKVMAKDLDPAKTPLFDVCSAPS